MDDKTKEKESIIKRLNELNIGIRILRIFLSFMVVIDHFYNWKKLHKYYYILYYHIPSFFLISFYFTYKTLISFNIKKIKLRLERLLIPYFSWSIISWLIRIFYYYIMKKKCSHSLKDFIANLINGHIFNVVLWFQNILILLTFKFLIIIYLFRNNYLTIFQLLLIISYILQYSGANYKFFNNFYRHTSSTFGRLFEALPNAVTGFFLALIDIINLINNKKKSKKSFIFSLLFLILISKYEVFAEIKTFKYGGIRLNLGAFCIFISFSLIPNTIYKFNLRNYIIKQMTNYTGGIYFTHYLIGKGYICSSFNIIKNKTILGCLFIYLVSYTISFLGIKFLGHTKLKHLFI